MTYGDGQTQSEAHSAKSRLFGGGDSDRLMKDMIKARLLRELQQPTAGDETQEAGAAGTVGEKEGELLTEPVARSLPIEPVRIGRFTVLRKIGHGGMGVVYAAYDEQLDRKVAIKVLRGELSESERTRTRMLREAQALARLSHPNVVQIHEIGEWRDHDFVAMEFIQGQTLDRWIHAKKRGWREVLDTLMQAGRGLGEAHRMGLVHRDFKPANVLVGDDGRARVLDFGLARAADSAEAGIRMDEVGETIDDAMRSLHSVDRSFESMGSTTGGTTKSAFDAMLTVTGAVIGTPAYMSPEQHLGTASTVLSDQFGFCVVLYESLFGHRPYRAETRTEYAVRVAEGDIIMPGGKSGVPAWLRKAVVRGLSPDPANRWPSMSDLLAELGRDRLRRVRGGLAAAGVLGLLGSGLAIASVEPEVCAYDASALEGVWGDSQREGVREAFAKISLASAAGLEARAVETLDDYSRELIDARRGACQDRWVHQAQSDAQLALRSACLDQRERELGAVVSVLETADEEVVRHSAVLLANLGEVGLCEEMDVLERAEGSLIPRDVETVEAVAELEQELARGRAALSVGRFDEVEAVLAQAQATELDYLPVTAKVELLTGQALVRKRANRDARPHLVASASMAYQMGDDATAAEAWLNLATAQFEVGAIEPAGETLGLASAAIERLGNPTMLRARHHALEGELFAKSGQPKSALIAYDLALGLETGGNPHLLAGVLASRSVAWAALGNSKSARADLERVLELESELGRTNHQILNAIFDLAIIELGEGNLDRADELFSDAVAGYQIVFGSDYPGLVHGQLARVSIALERGKVDEARLLVSTTLAKLDDDAEDRDWVLDAFAAVEMADGSAMKAREALGEALAIVGERGEDTARMAYLHGRLGEALAQGGSLDEALVHYDRSLELYANTELAGSSELGLALLGKGRILRAQGHARPALEALERGVEIQGGELSGDGAGELLLEMAELLAELDERPGLRMEQAKAALVIFDDLPKYAAQSERARTLAQP